VSEHNAPEGPRRPNPGEVEERTAAVEVEGKKIRGVVPYGVESRDMGGWRETIEPGALRATRMDDLIATVDHTGVPIGRFPRTLEIEDHANGLHWAVTPPASRSNLREAVERGDLRAGSWQMVVGRDEWRGNTRHVHEISELRDVAVVSSPAYPAAAVEYRAAPTTNQEDDMSEESTSEVRIEEERTEDTTQTSEQRTVSNGSTSTTTTPPSSTGTLRVEDRAQPAPRGLVDAFAARGWPAERATLDWGEYRAAVEFRSLTVSGAVDDVNQAERASTPYGYDVRYAFPASRTCRSGET
jgi:HK97 family phage prohead protease